MKTISTRRRSWGWRGGITLAETVAVMAALAVVTAMALPRFHKVLEDGKIMEARNG